MARNGSGTFNLYTPGNPVVTGTTISSSAFNNTMSDVATALTQSIAADGQTPVTANIPMNSKKLTGLAAGTTSGDALSYGQSGASVAGLAVGNADNAGATVLDWYLEGTWTPSLSFAGGNTGMSVGSSAGVYTRIGNIVHIKATLSSVTIGTASGNVTITGLPYAHTSGPIFLFGVIGSTQYLFGSRLAADASASTLQVYNGATGSQVTAATFSAPTWLTNEINFSGFYFV